MKASKKEKGIYLLARSFFCPLKKVYKSRKLAVRGLQKIHINVSSFIFIY